MARSRLACKAAATSRWSSVIGSSGIRGGTKMLGEIATGGQVILPLFARLVQSERGNPDGTVGTKVNRLFEERHGTAPDRHKAPVP